jgi:hypothetical protein
MRGLSHLIHCSWPLHGVAREVSLLCFAHKQKWCEHSNTCFSPLSLCTLVPRLSREVVVIMDVQMSKESTFAELKSFFVAWAFTLAFPNLTSSLLLRAILTQFTIALRT